MTRFRKILHVHSESPANAAALRCAAELAEAGRADLAAISVSKRLPKVADLREALLAYRRDEVAKALAPLAESHSLEVSVDHREGEPYVEVVRKVLREDRDLVVKAAEPRGRGSRRGFSPGDLQLLRQCPCPVWMVKGTKAPAATARILAAIDPVSDEDLGLTRRIVEIALAVKRSAGSGASLDFLHCWSLPHESAFRHHPFLKLPEERLAAWAAKEEQIHRRAAERAVGKALREPGTRLRVEKGDPAEVVPRLVAEAKADLVVMGTVGRTGIPGLFIGNTAETILRAVPCSVLAVKPPGFRSAVPLR